MTQSPLPRVVHPVAAEVSPLTSSRYVPIKAGSRRRLRSSWQPAALCLAGALGLVTTAATLSAAEFSWQRDPDALALVQNKQVIWQFHYGAKETKPAFHPVALPGGPVLTEFRPTDHPWHRGLWFSWKYINGVNYWEENKQTGVADGKTVQKSVKVDPRRNFSARVEMQLVYEPTNNQPVLTERRVIEISKPDVQGIYTIDWTQDFTAVADALLDRTPLPDEPNGKVFGGYAGLSVRAANAMTAPQISTPQGTAEFKEGRYRGKAAAMDYSGVLDGREVGMTILDHPGNLNSPSPWYAINSGPMRYFSPAVICYHPQPLKKGEKLKLRYRVIVHPDRWNAERLRAEIQRYILTDKR